MIKNTTLKLLPVFLLSALVGCAVGNTYDYRSANLSLPVEGSGKQVNVEVVDARPYILSGKKDPSFIGLQRGGYGNPFDVKTTSGQSLSEEFRAVISSSLMRSNFEVIDNAGTNIRLTIREWKTDAMYRFRLLYDMTLSIISKDRELLASASEKGDEVLSAAGFQGSNSSSASAAFENKVSRLFGDSEIRAVLEN